MGFFGAFALTQSANTSLFSKKHAIYTKRVAYCSWRKTLCANQLTNWYGFDNSHSHLCFDASTKPSTSDARWILSNSMELKFLGWQHMSLGLNGRICISSSQQDNHWNISCLVTDLFLLVETSHFPSKHDCERMSGLQSSLHGWQKNHSGPKKILRMSRNVWSRCPVFSVSGWTCLLFTTFLHS